jgi:putative ABC transport system permease protein
MFDRVLERALLRLVPRPWRSTVAADIHEEAQRDGRPRMWIAWQIARAAVRLGPATAFDAVVSDARYATRSLCRAPWSSAASVLTFALAIGVSTVVFAAIDRLTFRPLPYDEPGRILVLRELAADGIQHFGTLPADAVTTVRDRHSGVRDMAFTGATQAYALSPEPTDDATLRLVTTSHNILDVLGVSVTSGRPFTEDDARARRASVLITDRTWRTTFGSTPDVLGRRVWLLGRPAEIVGVLPPEFIVPSTMLDPLSDGLVLNEEMFEPFTKDDRSLPPYVRLVPDVSLDSVQAELDSLLAPSQRAASSTTRIRFVPLDSDLFGYYQPYARLVSLAAFLLLAGACANIANLLVIRGRARDREAAMQVALGASRWRVARSFLIEAGALGAAGGALALCGAAFASRVFDIVLPPIFSRYAAPAWDLRVVSFAVVVVGASALTAGIWPALRARHLDILGLLQRAGTPGRASRRAVGSSILGAEAVLGVVLVVGAALTTRSLIGLLETPTGYAPERLLSVSIGLEPGQLTILRHEDSVRAIEMLGALPQVESIAAADTPSMYGDVPYGFGAGFLGRGATRRRISSGYFSTAGIQLVAGRPITEDDVTEGRAVSALSESGVRRVWPELRENPAAAVGRVLRFEEEDPRTVIGVVGDVRSSHAAAPEATHYVPLTATGFRQQAMLVRLRPGAALRSADVREALHTAGLAPSSVRIIDQAARLQDRLLDQRFRAAMFSLFGVVGWVLAMVGIVAATAFDTAQRRHELGIRHALGARPRALQMLVLRGAAAAAAIGVGLGLILAFSSAVLLQAFLHEVDARDPWTYALVAFVLVATAVVAAWLPARRAARTDPAAVLRAV